MFKQIAGVDMVHVPYRGAGPAIQDLIAGNVQVMFDSVTLQMPQLTAGKSRALAVMSAQRVDVLPEVETMIEAGFKEMAGGTWFGLFAPAGTPPQAIAWVNAEARKAFASPEARQKFLAQGASLPLGTPASSARTPRRSGRNGARSSAAPASRWNRADIQNQGLSGQLLTCCEVVLLANRRYLCLQPAMARALKLRQRIEAWVCSDQARPAR